MIYLLFVLILLGAFFIYSSWAWATVIQKAWLWFAIPSFPEYHLQPLTFIQGLTISIFIGLIIVRMPRIYRKSERHMTIAEKEDKVLQDKASLINLLVLPWLVMVVLFFIKWYFVG